MGLYDNINRRKRNKSSRPKSKSTITPKAYAEMQKGFPNSKKNKAKKQSSWIFLLLDAMHETSKCP